MAMAMTMKPSSMFYVHEADVAHIHHFLEDCSLCGKSLSGDIFMYRHAPPSILASHQCNAAKLSELRAMCSCECPRGNLRFLFRFWRVCVCAEVTRRSAARSAGSSRSRWTGRSTGGRSTRRRTRCRRGKSSSSSTGTTITTTNTNTVSTSSHGGPRPLAAQARGPTPGSPPGALHCACDRSIDGSNQHARTYTHTHTHDNGLVAISGARTHA